LLHRVVSPRNVRRTADGRAKLIDFGAMTSTGVSVEVMGTPPFIAPEVLQNQQVDSRADLFSLGALAYFVLSGRHAYPARSINDLRDLWRSRVPSLVQLVPELPPALDALVMQLLALDRNARPGYAAEVISRLCAIASLPSDEHDSVPYAYLKMPTLVGRDAALLVIRRRMLALVRGDGSALYVEGVAGSGRSRMLETAALEAKLAGAAVVCADARAAVNADFGVARALYAQLCKLVPDEAAKAARLLPSLERLSAEPAAARPAHDETVVVRELRDFVLTLCRNQRLVITVDDADHIDERSAAWLTSLGHRAKRNSLLLVYSLDREGRTSRSAALRLLCAGSERLEIEELSAEHTELLMRSVFGDVAHLAMVAGRVHSLSHGNPRAAMTFAQHLVDSKLAQYEAGRWALSAYIGESDMPATQSASLSLRLATLGQDARELSEVLALADGTGITLPDYALLTSHADENRIFTALDELIAAAVLVADAERYGFTRHSYIAVVRDEMPAARATAIHSRLADWLDGTSGGVGRRVHHLFEAGRDLEAIELLRHEEQAQLPALPLLERAVERAQHHGFDIGTILKLRAAIVAKAAHSLEKNSFRRHAPVLLAQIEADCGLARYRELADVAESVRLVQALRDTQQRYQEARPEVRGYALLAAFQELARICNSYCVMAMSAMDVGLLESFPAIDPLIPLSPALELIRQRVEIARAWLQGRVDRCTDLQEAMLVRIGQPDRSGLDEAKRDELVLALNYGLGALEAATGSANAERRAQLLESHPQTRIIAWMLRHVLALNQGNVEESRRCLRRAELYRLQLGAEGPPSRLGAGIQLLGYARLGDMLGVKSAVDDLAALAREHAGWQPVLLLGQSHYRKLQGDLEGALAAIEEAIQLVQRRGSLYFTRIAATHIDLLTLLGRDDDALDRARSYLERFDFNERRIGDPDLYAAAAVAFSKGGEHERAVQLLDQAIAQSHGIGRMGIPLGLLYYARARVAISMADRTAFERYADLCAEEFKRTKNPSVIAKFERLLEAAADVDLALEVQPAHVRELLDMGRAQSVYVTLRSRIDECFDASDRARCALTLLLEHVQGFAGYLYGVSEDGVRLLAALPEELAERPIDAWVDAHVAAERTDDPRTSGPPPARRHGDDAGRLFEAVLLHGTVEGAEHLAAVFVHQATSDARAVDRELLTTLADALLARRDVTGVKLEAVVTV
jgi:hypothetical protein